MAEARDDQALRAKLLMAAARLTHDRNDFAASAALSRKMLDLYQAIGDRQGEADAHERLATALMNMYELEEARRHFAQSAALYQSFGQRHG